MVEKEQPKDNDSALSDTNLVSADNNDKNNESRKLEE